MAAKKLARRVEALGAGSLLPRGLGDDQHPFGYEAALDPWLRALWPALRTHHPLPPGTPEVPPPSAPLLGISRIDRWQPSLCRQTAHWCQVKRLHGIDR